jgi:hypothetical protein
MKQLIFLTTFIFYIFSAMHSGTQEAASIASTETILREREARRTQVVKKYLTDETVPFTEAPLPGIWGTSIYVYLHSRYGIYPTDGLNTKNGRADADYDDCFIFAVPISSITDTQDDLPFGVQAALRYIKDVQEAPPAIPVIVAFLAGEWDYTTASPAAKGFAALLDSDGLDYRAIILYAALFSASPPVRVIRSSDSYTTPLPILDTFIEMCARYAVPVASSSNSFFSNNDSSHGRLQPKMTEHIDIPVLYITNADDAGSIASALSVEDFASSITIWSETLNGIHKQLIADNDTNYIFFTARGRTVIIPEKTIVLFSFIAALLLLALLFLFGKYSKKHGKNRLRHPLDKRPALCYNYRHNEKEAHDG